MCLNSGGVGVAGSVKGVEQGFVKPDFCKCHESLSNGTASRSRTKSAHGRKKMQRQPTNSLEILCQSERLHYFSAQKALCQGGVYRIDTRRQEGFRDAARFAKRVTCCRKSLLQCTGAHCSGSCGSRRANSRLFLADGRRKHFSNQYCLGAKRKGRASGP